VHTAFGRKYRRDRAIAFGIAAKLIAVQFDHLQLALAPQDSARRGGRDRAIVGLQEIAELDVLRAIDQPRHQPVIDTFLEERVKAAPEGLAIVANQLMLSVGVATRTSDKPLFLGQEITRLASSDRG
jgi:hypothetical protein